MVMTGGGVVFSYSQKLVAGMGEQFLVPSHCASAGSRPPNCGGPGMPQRAMTRSRSPSAPLRTIGASWSGRSRGTVRIPGAIRSGRCSRATGLPLAIDLAAHDRGRDFLFAPSPPNLRLVSEGEKDGYR